MQFNHDIILLFMTYNNKIIFLIKQYPLNIFIPQVLLLPPLLPPLLHLLRHQHPES